jgi:hypothetical protein
MLIIKRNQLKPHKQFVLVMLVAILYVYGFFCLLGLFNEKKYGAEFTLNRFMAEIFAFEGENIFAALLFPCYSVVASFGLAKIKWVRQRKLIYHGTAWFMSILLIVIISSFGGGISTWKDMIRILVFSLYSFWISWGVRQRDS